jgi:hypothetical protein
MGPGARAGEAATLCPGGPRRALRRGPPAALRRRGRTDTAGKRGLGRPFGPNKRDGMILDILDGN